MCSSDLLAPQTLSTILLVALAVTVVVSLQAVGIILSVAMLVTPGATARMLSDSIWRMLWLSPLVAAVAVLVRGLAELRAQCVIGRDDRRRARDRVRARIRLRPPRGAPEGVRSRRHILPPSGRRATYRGASLWGASPLRENVSVYRSFWGMES